MHTTLQKTVTSDITTPGYKQIEHKGNKEKKRKQQTKKSRNVKEGRFCAVLCCAAASAQWQLMPDADVDAVTNHVDMDTLMWLSSGC
jgi:hypothetical protein